MGGGRGKRVWGTLMRMSEIIFHSCALYATMEWPGDEATMYALVSAIIIQMVRVNVFMNAKVHS